MYRIIPFEEIEKNKWNGTIHYALNGNIFGYYWYLKAVIGEWDAIVEEDYESVMPVFRTPLKPYQYNLLRELGPYSVNPLTDKRMEEFLKLFRQANKSSQYPIHSQVSNQQISEFNAITKYKAVLPGGFEYEKLSGAYSDELSENINVKGYDTIKIVGGLKPELLVELWNENDRHKNALLRLMYNAMHRGIGFSSGIQDKTSGKILAAGFFMGSNTTMYEIFSFSQGGKKYRQLIFDLLLRNNSGSPQKFESFININDLHEMGFDSEPVQDIQLSMSTFAKLKKSLGNAY